jgi:hypothetical protein
MIQKTREISNPDRVFYGGGWSKHVPMRPSLQILYSFTAHGGAPVIYGCNVPWIWSQVYSVDVIIVYGKDFHFKGEAIWEVSGCYSEN